MVPFECVSDLVVLYSEPGMWSRSRGSLVVATVRSSIPSCMPPSHMTNRLVLSASGWAVPRLVLRSTGSGNLATFSVATVTKSRLAVATSSTDSSTFGGLMTRCLRL